MPSQTEARQATLAGFLAPGMRLGKYQLVRQLAVGGMAEVYLARAQGIEGFQKSVVLKRILPQFAATAEFVDMFLDEARLAAGLDHSNIVQVYDIGSQVGNYYFTMEYVRGQDVRAILKAAHEARQRVPLACSLEIARGLCAGLHYAHDKRDEKGEPLHIVHRDVSLSNVLVSYDGAVKIADFGVAKSYAGHSETQVGTLKGKIAYMSPEQCRGEPLDRRSDVFAIGIVLYELTTGSRLFAGENEFATLQAIATRDVEPPSRRWPDYPAELEAIVLKALQRDRELRFESARDLQRAIEEFARRRALALSAIDLGEYMQRAFADEIAAEPSDSVGGRASGPPPVPLRCPRGTPVDHVEPRGSAQQPAIAVEPMPAIHTAMFQTVAPQLVSPARQAEQAEQRAEHIDAEADFALDISFTATPRAHVRHALVALLAVAVAGGLWFAARGVGTAPIAPIDPPAVVPAPGTTPKAAEPLERVRIEIAPPDRPRLEADQRPARPADADGSERRHRRRHRHDPRAARAQSQASESQNSEWNPDSALPP